MQYRTMGRTDLRVSVIGFGCWPMGGNQYGPVEDAEEIAAVHRALDLGITLYDTAPIYGHGHSEEVLGRALGPRRKDVVLVTKGGLHWDPATLTMKRDSRRTTILTGVDDSLRRLNTDWIDLLLVHWPDVQTPFAETMQALNDAVAAGKVRYVGVSNFSAAQLRECSKVAPLCANQVGYNLFDRRWEREIFPLCARLGVGIMAYGSLAHGLLTGTFDEHTSFVDWDWRSRGGAFGQAIFSPENFPKNLQVVRQLKDIAQSRGATLPQLALAWVIQHPQASTALVGARRPVEVEENLGALEVNLSAADIAQLDDVMTAAAGLVEQIPT